MSNQHATASRPLNQDCPAPEVASEAVSLDEFAYIDRIGHQRPITSQNALTRKTSRNKQRRWMRLQCGLLREWIAAHDSVPNAPFWNLNFERLTRMENELRESEEQHANHQGRNLDPKDLPPVDPWSLVGLPDWRVRWLLRFEDPEPYRKGIKERRQERKRELRELQELREAPWKDLVTVSPAEPATINGDTLAGILAKRRLRGAA